MKFLHLINILVCFCLLSDNVSCFEPITLTLYAAVGILGSYYLSSKDNVVTNNVYKVVKKIGQKIGYFEGCEDFWIPGNMEALKMDLEENIYGQKIAIDMVVNALSKHVPNKYSTRPLTLSFHGDPGIGKTYVSKKILEHMFRQGKNTEYVHFFRGSIDFPVESELYKYKEEVSQKIKDKIYECHRSVFVFDEVEKMPSGILDVLRGFINQGKSGDYDYRRAVFILLSNVGGKSLFQETFQSFKDGQDREHLDRKYLSKLLAEEAYNAKGGLKGSSLIRSLSISQYIPFLPLERRHVIQCLRKEVEKLNQKMSDELIEQVLQELRFIPDDNPTYADGGCKIVSEKVQFFITRQQRRNRMNRYS